jgi:hypothetical protein
MSKQQPASDEKASTGFFERLFDVWWGRVLLGLFVAAGGVFVFMQLSSVAEGEVESIRVRRWVKLLYDIGGRWLAPVICWVSAAGLIAWGLWMAFVNRGRTGRSDDPGRGASTPAVESRRAAVLPQRA